MFSDQTIPYADGDIKIFDIIQAEIKASYMNVEVKKPYMKVPYINDIKKLDIIDKIDIPGTPVGEKKEKSSSNSLCSISSKKRKGSIDINKLNIIPASVKSPEMHTGVDNPDVKIPKINDSTYIEIPDRNLIFDDS